MPVFHSSEESVLPDKKYSTFLEWERVMEEAKRHMCTLPGEPDIVDIYVRHGPFLKLRRWFRRFTMISERNPNVKLYFKSMAAVKQEMLRHIRYHYHILHPMSKATAYWRFLMLVNLLAILVVIPAVITTRMDFMRPIKLVLDLFFIADTFVNFNTGYEVYSRKEVVMAKKAIRKHYILGYYFLDFFSSLPFDYFMYLIGRPTLYTMVLPTLKLFKLRQLSQNMNLFYQWFDVNLFLRKLDRILLIHIYVIWWTTCLTATIVVHSDKSKSWYYKVYPDDDDTLALMLLCFFRSAYMCTSVGYGNMASNVLLDHVLDFVCLTIGAYLFVFWMAELLQFLNKSESTYMRYQDLMQQIREYLSFRELPPVMTKRINTYYEYRFNQKFYREQSIMSTISPHLKHEITFESCRRVLESVSFFRVLPRRVLRKLSPLMKRETFLTNDVVMYPGSKMKAMYFLASGTAAVYQKNGKELCHLEDKAHFGELSFLTSEELSSPGVVAVSACDFYVLSKRNYIKFRDENSEEALKIKRLLYERLERTIAFKETYEIDVTPPYCLIEEHQPSI